MANIGSYDKKGFNVNNGFLNRENSTGETIRTTGQDIIDGIDQSVPFQSLETDVALRVLKVDSMANLNFVGNQNQQVSVKGWHPDSDVGGGVFYYDPNRAKSDHNGGTVVSNTVPWTTTTADFLNGVGETAPGANGVWVKVYEFLFADDFGAKSDGSTDDWDSINAALQTYEVVHLRDKRTYSVSQQLSLRQNQHLKLGADTTLLMPSALTSTTEPVVWVLAPFASIRGEGPRSSYIQKDYESPDGIVKLGAQSMSIQANAIFHCVLEGFEMIGEQAYGQTSGNPDVGLHMPSPELNLYFNYYHVLKDLGVRNVNIGFWFRGFANGIFASNLYGVNVGNTSIQSCLILHQGALDNMVHDVFFNQSNDVTGVIVEDLDNTLNGTPIVCESQHNTYRGIVCEQGGSAELAFDIRTSRSSYFEVRDNVTSGNSLFANFQADNNTFFSGRTVIFPLDTSANQLDITARLNLQRTTPGTLSEEGMTLGNGVSNSITTDDDFSMIFNRTTDSGSTSNQVLQLRKDETYFASLSAGSTDRAAFANASVGIGFDDSAGFVGPMDNECNFLDLSTNLGDSGARWSNGYFQKIQGPNEVVFTQIAAASAVNSSLFVDSADGKLKFKDSGGTVNLLY